MLLTEVKITVTLILRSKTRIRRNFYSAAPFSCDRHNIRFCTKRGGRVIGSFSSKKDEWG